MFSDLSVAEKIKHTLNIRYLFFIFVSRAFYETTWGRGVGVKPDGLQMEIFFLILIFFFVYFQSTHTRLQSIK